mmetsp:Transcript_12981/g.23086  ORF Transcript_12981/g.23086 Transcript_12981/m.23086 type:complete len:111 (-) Transcript_12981:172-504(-)
MNHFAKARTLSTASKAFQSGLNRVNTQRVVAIASQLKLSASTLSGDSNKAFAIPSFTKMSFSSNSFAASVVNCDSNDSNVATEGQGNNGVSDSSDSEDSLGQHQKPKKGI